MNTFHLLNIIIFLTLYIISCRYEQMKEKLVVREREVEMLRASLEQTSHYQLQTEIKSLQDAIGNQKLYLFGVFIYFCYSVIL